MYRTGALQDGRESENQGGNTMSMNPQDGSRPTVVLVHGAFADGSSWNGVIERLQAEGVQVTAPANPLRGISIDSAYINSLLNQGPGPVLAVGHSYGGAVITNVPPPTPTTSSSWSTSPPSPRTKVSA